LKHNFFFRILIVASRYRYYLLRYATGIVCVRKEASISKICAILVIELAINTFLQSTVKVFSTIFVMNIRKQFYFKTMLHILYVSTKIVLLL